MKTAFDFESHLDESYQAVGAYNADILYIYTDFRYLGFCAGFYPNRDEFCKAVVQPLLRRGKTIILTTFTYTSDGIFDVLSTPTKLGALNKWILGQPNCVRSEHPIFSYAALGPAANILTTIGKSAFGFDSVFERLKNRKAAFLHIGRPVRLGNTSLHHVEHACGATYRMNKAFPTKVYKANEYIGTDYTAFLRRRDIPGETFDFDFTKAAEMLFQREIIKEVGSSDKLNNISFYWYDDTIDYLYNLFNKNQRLFIKTDYIGY